MLNQGAPVEPAAPPRGGLGYPGDGAARRPAGDAHRLRIWAKQLDTNLRTLVVLVVLGLTACASPDRWEQGLPQDLRDVIKHGSTSDLLDLINQRYRENFGKSFPNLELTHTSGASRRLSDFSRADSCAC